MPQLPAPARILPTLESEHSDEHLSRKPPLSNIVDHITGTCADGGRVDLQPAEADHDDEQSIPVREHPSTRLAPSGLLDREEFHAAMKADVAALVLKCQIHRHSDTCKKYGYVYCRFGYPRSLEPESTVRDGRLVHERGCRYVNNYNAWIMIIARANHDIKFICTGYDAKSLIMYTTLTNYITKSDLSGDSAHRMLSDWMTCLSKLPPPQKDSALDRSRTLLLKLSNKMTARTDRGGPLVLTHVLGLPDHYTSHEFSPLLFNSFLSYANAQAPVVKQDPVSLHGDSKLFHPATDDDREQRDAEFDEMEEGNLVELLEDYEIYKDVRTGEFSLSSQRIDYMLRGKDLADLSLYEWVEQFMKRGPIYVPEDSGSKPRQAAVVSHLTIVIHNSQLMASTCAVAAALFRILWVLRYRVRLRIERTTRCIVYCYLNRSPSSLAWVHLRSDRRLKTGTMLGPHFNLRRGLAKIRKLVAFMGT